MLVPWSQDPGSVFQAKKPRCPPGVWPVRGWTEFPAKPEEGGCCCTEGCSSSRGRPARPRGSWERHCCGIFFSLLSLGPGDGNRSVFSPLSRWGMRTYVRSSFSWALFASRVIWAGLLSNLDEQILYFHLAFKWSFKWTSNHDSCPSFLKIFHEVHKCLNIFHKVARNSHSL